MYELLLILLFAYGARILKTTNQVALAPFDPSTGSGRAGLRANGVWLRLK
jgi:hypothetical protein